MEHIAYLLFIIAKHSLIFLVPSIFLAIFVATAASKLRKAASAAKMPDGGGRPVSGSIFGFVLPVVSILMVFLALCVAGISLINVIRPHLVDGELINAYGEEADAKVLSKEMTNNLHNQKQVERYHVIYRTKSGEDIETYFESWDFNIYPAANSVSYPAPGTTFKVIYLPAYPSTFLILTNEKSEYSESLACRDILHDIEEKRNKYEFDKKSPRFVGEYMQALSKGIENKCGDNLMEELRKIGDSSNK